jgi:hypothetical protein
VTDVASPSIGVAERPAPKTCGQPEPFSILRCQAVASHRMVAVAPNGNDVATDMCSYHAHTSAKGYRMMGWTVVVRPV